MDLVSPQARLLPKITPKGRDLYQAPGTWCQFLLEGSMVVLLGRLNVTSMGLSVSPSGLHNTTSEGLIIPRVYKALAGGTQIYLRVWLLPKIMPKGRDLYQGMDTWCQFLLEGSMEVPPRMLNVPHVRLIVSPICLHDTTFKGFRIPIVDKTLVRKTWYLLERDCFWKVHLRGATYIKPRGLSVKSF